MPTPGTGTDTFDNGVGPLPLSDLELLFREFAGLLGVLALAFFTRLMAIGATLAAIV